MTKKELEEFDEHFAKYGVDLEAEEEEYLSFPERE